jgi:galactose mutarotase-like enzyme
MPDLRVSSDWTYRGLTAVVLENRFLRVVILPQLGGKIYQITYKPFDTELLWNNPRITPARHPMNSRYDDVWCGGWDELFPNDEVTAIAGEAYPDHGELWTGEWRAEAIEGVGEAGVVLRFETPISSMHVEKIITLRANQARIHFRHKFTNMGGACFPFLWKLHPAFAVSPQHRIDFPPMKVVLEPAFAGTLGGAVTPCDWPQAQVSGRKIDLSRVPGDEERQVYFFYGTEMKESWCALTNTETGLACGIHFDAAVFGSCWLFASYGGWRNYNVAVLEPCTGYPLNFEAMHAAGRARVLAPGASLTTEVLFSVQPNTHCVGKVYPDGTMTACPGIL